MPNRRANTTVKVTWTTYGGSWRTVLVTFGFDADYRVAEVFSADFKAGSDTLGIVTYTCILLSRLFQMGVRPQELLLSMSEPYSLIGTIIDAAVAEEEFAARIGATKFVEKEGGAPCQKDLTEDNLTKEMMEFPFHGEPAVTRGPSSWWERVLSSWLWL
jgi:hypothetical protein